MKILATVLLGPGADKNVSGAIESCATSVDGFLLIESGGGEPALDAAYAAIPAGHVRTAHTFRWTGSYADGRNFALNAAREAGADYAVTLDPDERVHLAANYRDLIGKHPEVLVWVAEDRAECYYKERIIRCAGDHAWHGRVCENVIAGPQVMLPGSHFTELPKDEAAEVRRRERGVVECQRMIDEGDERFKWYRHMASCLTGLGRLEEAFAANQKAVELAQTPEDQARARFHVCEHLVLQERYDEARALAAVGLADFAGYMQEFGWILAWCDHKSGSFQNSARWAQIVSQMPRDRTRIGWRSKNAIHGARTLLAHYMAQQHKEAAE